MSCNDIFTSQLHRPLKQLFKFQIPVAVQARIRRKALFVRIDKTIDNLTPEIFCKIKYIIWDL